MEKKYQVFVSSTYEDLKPERQEVMQALLELDCIPAGMELFPAADDDQWTLIQRVIDDCDYYIVIVGGRYGSLSGDGLSYTQKEYEYAIEQSKPIIGFIHKDPETLPAAKSEKTSAGRKKLLAFRDRVRQKPCKEWSTPAELGSVVSRSLVKLIKAKPAIGWVRANLVPDESTSKEILSLKNEIELLNSQLQDARTSAPAGTSDLAQGDDEFDISFLFSRQKKKYSAKNPVNYSWVKVDDTWETYKTTWGKIFSWLAPNMIRPTSEAFLMQELIRIYERDIDGLRKKKYPDERHFGFKISSESFNTIKIQLRALGLIKLTDYKNHDHDANEYWMLTPYGDNLLTQIYAMKKVKLKSKKKK